MKAELEKQTAQMVSAHVALREVAQEEWEQAFASASAAVPAVAPARPAVRDTRLWAPGHAILGIEETFHVPEAQAKQLHCWTSIVVAERSENDRDFDWSLKSPAVS